MRPTSLHRRSPESNCRSVFRTASMATGSAANHAETNVCEPHHRGAAIRGGRCTAERLGWVPYHHCNEHPTPARISAHCKAAVEPQSWQGSAEPLAPRAPPRVGPELEMCGRYTAVPS